VLHGREGTVDPTQNPELRRRNVSLRGRRDQLDGTASGGESNAEFLKNASRDTTKRAGTASDQYIEVEKKGHQSDSFGFSKFVDEGVRDHRRVIGGSAENGPAT